MQNNDTSGKRIRNLNDLENIGKRLRTLIERKGMLKKELNFQPNRNTPVALTMTNK